MEDILGRVTFEMSYILIRAGAKVHVCAAVLCERKKNSVLCRLKKKILLHLFNFNIEDGGRGGCRGWLHNLLAGSCL